MTSGKRLPVGEQGFGARGAKSAKAGRRAGGQGVAHHGGAGVVCLIKEGAVARAADAGGGVGQFLQQRVQVAPRREGGAGAVDQFKCGGFFAQGFLGALDLVDIGAGAEPAHQLAIGVAYGVGAHQEPAEFAAGTADRHFELERLAAGSALLP